MTDLRYPTEMDPATVPSWIQFIIFDRKDISSSSPISTINLYMPEETSQPSTVKWSDAELWALGAGIHNVSEEDYIGALKNMFLSAGIRTLGGFASQKIETLGGDYDIVKNFASVTTGKTLNPYLTAIFEGVDFRTFTFRFKFTPHKESDCDIINNIIKEFRKAALPAGGESAVFDYPREVEIKYWFNGKPNNFLNKFKRSIIESIDVNYGMGDGWTVYRNGFPTFIQLTMRFKEVKIVTREDIDTGH